MVIMFAMMMFPERFGLKDEWWDENEPLEKLTWFHYWENGDKERATRMFKEMYGY